jgi:multiple sugar transport system ATP-binding protein
LEKNSFAGSLQIRKVNKWYLGNVHAVIDLDMEINRGEFIVLSVPLDAGKRRCCA